MGFWFNSLKSFAPFAFNEGSSWASASWPSKPSPGPGFSLGYSVSAWNFWKAGEKKTNQFPSVCNYSWPDIFIPYEGLDFNQAGLRSWMEKGILWESSSPLELSLFRECLHVLCKSWLCFPMPWVWTQVTLDPKVPRPACDIPALPRSSLSICTLTDQNTAALATWGSPTEEPPQWTGQTMRTADRRQTALQMRRKLMTNKQQRGI